MERFEKIIAVYSYGLGCGLYNIYDIVSLCDYLIETKDSVPIEIIETSLMSKCKIDDIEHKLMSLINQIDYEEITVCILGLLYKKLISNELTIEQVIRCIAKILLHTGLCYNSNYYTLYSLDDSYDLANAGVCFNLNDVIEHLNIELQKYEGYGVKFSELMSDEFKIS